MTQTWLITGANRGIGLELAKQARDAGHDIIGTARNPSDATELNALGVRVEQLDQTDQKSVDALTESLDGVTIHVLINNAGAMIDAGPVETLDFDKINEQFNINTLGPARITTALLPNLKAAESAKIINTTSNLGSIAQCDNGAQIAYRISKAALNMLTSCQANHLAEHNIITVCMHPGWVQTDMGGENAPTPRHTSASDIINTVHNLKPSDNATFLRHDGELMPW